MDIMPAAPPPPPPKTKLIPFRPTDRVIRRAISALKKLSEKLYPGGVCNPRVTPGGCLSLRLGHGCVEFVDTDIGAATARGAIALAMERSVDGWYSW